MRLCIATCTFIILLTLNSYAENRYTVKKGDTLYDIALTHNTSVKKIKELNKLGSENLTLGQTLELPSTYSSYKVKKGDTLGTIAVKHGLTSSKDLVEFNNLTNTSLSIGQSIKIPLNQPVNKLDKTKEVKIQKSDAKIVHTVKEKESLYVIAKMHGSSVDAIKAKNSLSTIDLKPGQKLIIPPAAEIKQADNLQATKEVKVQSVTHKVVSGDTLGHIAVKYGLSSSREIIAANGLKNNDLKLGQVLVIPVEKKAEDTKEIKVQSFPVQKESSKLTFKTNNSDPKDSKPLSLKTETKQKKIVKAPGIKKTEEVQVNTYVVKPGDTLGQIAVKHGIASSKEIIKFNNLQSSKLSIGQEIKIPAQGVETPVVTAVTAEPEKTSIKITHTVKSSDTLYGIARMHGTSVDKIKAENRLIGNKLSIGQKLIIPPADKKTQVVKSEVKESPVKKAPKPVTVSKKKEFKGTYKVRSGDTLSQIADSYNIKTNELRAANGISGNNIRVGQKLSVPDTAPINPKSARASKTRPDIYTVKKGDTLIGIAKKYDTNVAALTNFNNLNSLTLNIGDKLRIPDKSYKYTSSGNIKYRVKKGDTLSTIARNFKVTVTSIKAANGLRSSKIRAGTRLTIPTAKRNTTVVKHTVRRGDTLSSIARKHRSSVSSIKSANNLKNSYIRPGQKLKVPSTVNRYVTKVRTPKNKKIDKNIFSNDYEAKNELIRVAKQYLGAPYKFGGTSTRTGIDCSAYVNKVYGIFDVNLPRTARDIYKKGHWVSKGKLQKGDLVFFTTYAKFPSHVGIYIGNNKFIHASSASKRVTITNINKNYYKKRYIGAKRISIKNVYAKKSQ